MPSNLFGILMEIPSNARTYHRGRDLMRLWHIPRSREPHVTHTRSRAGATPTTARRPQTLKPDVRADVYRTGTGHGAGSKPIMALLGWATNSNAALPPSYMTRETVLSPSYIQYSLYTCNTGPMDRSLE
jgi:hypothetical protein